MVHHYYFISRLAAELGKVLKEAVLVSAFSQQKDELILEFEKNDGSGFILKAELQQGVGLLSFPDSFQRARGNAADLFPEIISQKIREVKPVLFDRSFHLVFENDLQLCFKLYGNRCNVLLHNGIQTLKVFNHHLKNDLSAPPPTDIKELLPLFGTYSPDPALLKKHHPMLGKEEMADWEKIKRNAEPENEEALFRQFLHQLSKGMLYVCKKNKLVFVTVFPEGEILLKSLNPIEIAHFYQKVYWTINRFEKEKEQCLDIWEKNQFRIREQIRITEEQIRKHALSEGYRLQADLLMAYATQIEKGAEKVALPLFDGSKTLEIKVKKDLSVTENANRLYRKAKGEKENEKYLEQRLSEWKEQLVQNEAACQKIKEAKNRSDLKLYFQKEILVQENEEQQPYRLRTYMDFDIWIGKNAKGNDEMLRMAHKDDIWLHARNVAGSHVIIRRKKNQPIPKPVLEKAAEWAAYYSKAKSESLTAVIFTEKKYVRKLKGMPAGMVKTEKENTLLVKPQA